ncbi:MAG: tRNA dihydrouridine synthase DusB [Thiotrichaceae bacterium]
MQIGPYTLSSKLLLAPMAGITDPPFRSLCKQFGAGLATSEMLTSDINLWNSKKSAHRLPHADETEPRSVQIAGTDPIMMAKAAQLSIEKGAQIIDINMGCPAKKVCNKAAGSALMQDPQTARAIIEAVTQASSVPVTLKIRTGWSRKNRNALEIAKIAEQNDIKALSIHGRTRQDAYLGYAEYETIRRVKHAISIPVIANGDLRDKEDLRFVLDYTHVDGLMIGRSAQGQPWIFQQYNELLKTGKLPIDPPFSKKREIILDHIKHIHLLFGDRTGVRIARKHIGWYLNKLSIPADKIKLIFGAQSPENQVHLLNEVLGNPPNEDKV